MKKPALQRYRLLAQMGFFALFTLTPIFDLLRYDLTEKHAYFLTYQWHVGIDDLIAGRVDPQTAAVNLIFRVNQATILDFDIHLNSPQRCS